MEKSSIEVCKGLYRFHYQAPVIKAGVLDLIGVLIDIQKILNHIVNSKERVLQVIIIPRL